LLDRLPQQPASYHVDSASGPPVKFDNYEDITAALKALVAGGIIPIQWLEKFSTAKPENVTEH